MEAATRAIGSWECLDWHFRNASWRENASKTSIIPFPSLRETHDCRNRLAVGVFGPTGFGDDSITTQAGYIEEASYKPVTRRPPRAW